MSRLQHGKFLRTDVHYWDIAIAVNTKEYLHSHTHIEQSISIRLEIHEHSGCVLIDLRFAKLLINEPYDLLSRYETSKMVPI